MIDISDGLSTDLGHICEESGVGAEIETEAIPVAMAGSRGSLMQFALHGGEDYELLFTAPPRKKSSISDCGCRRSADWGGDARAANILVDKKGVKQKLRRRVGNTSRNSIDCVGPGF